MSLGGTGKLWRQGEAALHFKGFGGAFNVRVHWVVAFGGWCKSSIVIWTLCIVCTTELMITMTINEYE